MVCAVSQTVLMICAVSQTVLMICAVSHTVLMVCAVSQTVLMICAVSQTVLMIRAVSHTVLMVCAVSQTVLIICAVLQNVVVILGLFVILWLDMTGRTDFYWTSWQTCNESIFTHRDRVTVGALNVQFCFGFKFLLLCVVHGESSRHRAATDVCCRNAVLHADSPIDRLPLFRMEGEGCERLHQNAVGIISVLVLSHNPHHT
jgi:hypothetical protein